MPRWTFLLAVLLLGLACGDQGPVQPEPPPPSASTSARPFSNSQDCRACHPRQFNEWRSSPHAYTGISPTFYSLVAAGQNSRGAGVLSEIGDEVSMGGGVGNFCLPCHSPIGFTGLEGHYGGNNGGFAGVQPLVPFVCAPFSPSNPLEACTTQNSVEDCGEAGLCVQFEGRTCVNMPPVSTSDPFPRIQVHCTDDADCAAGVNGCPDGGENCGPCIIAPTTIYYTEEAQEGINCEACHNLKPNHQRSCQLFREADSVGVLSIDLAQRETADGRRLRLGPYPVQAGSGPGGTPDRGQGLLNDTLPLVANAFHESARVDTPLLVAYDQTDRADPDNPTQQSIHVVRPTAVTCQELPYCGPGSICQGGMPTVIGEACMSDEDCGGCGASGLCGVGGPRAGEACETSIDCAWVVNTGQNLLDRAIDNTLDETITPLTRPLDRPDGNYYRSSMFCGTCHDVRPPFANAILKSCEEQPTHVCSGDSDCLNLNVGCSGNDCGPCVVEQNSSSLIASSPAGVMPAPGDPANNGYRRVENLFSEWQISLYAHPELTFCRQNSFKACTADADCMDGLFDEGPCDLSSPYGGEVITCQDCHMSNFPLTPLIDAAGTVVDKNDLYPFAKAAIEGSQSDVSSPIPARRVSTHHMAGVDLPLVKYPGQAIQAVRRQQLIDSGFKITLDETPSTATAGVKFEVEVTVENVGVGHRFPAGFSHERQNWLQVFVQEKDALDARGIGDKPFFLDLDDPASSAPCHLQRHVATSTADSKDPDGAVALASAGCVFRSGFLLDKAHPETGEMEPDGSLDDEDPEDFFVAIGTRVRGRVGDLPRIEVNPGTEGRALDIQFICEEETAEVYREAIEAGSGIDTGVVPSHMYQARLCDPGLTPAEGPGHTAPGYGNPGCMEGGADVGPCVPEIELSDGNERGRCAGDITKGTCQNDADCGPDGPCLYRCSLFPELECCDQNDPTCAAFYARLGTDECEMDSLACVGGSNAGEPCLRNSMCAGGGTCEETRICIGGSNSGGACSEINKAADCPGSLDIDGTPGNCGNVGPCRIENTGITNFQNQFRNTENGVCVDPNNPIDPQGRPIPLIRPGTNEPAGCFLNLQCNLQGLGGNVCLVNGECSDDSPMPGKACTNVTYRDDCGIAAHPNAQPGTCNVEFNLELNGRPSESVFIQNHPFNFNSMAPLQPYTFFYDFEVPAALVGKELIVSVRLFNRHFPMRFLRNLIGTQTVRPPFIVEAGGDASNPSECNSPRQIDIDCFVKPVVTLGQAEVGGRVTTDPDNPMPTMKAILVMP
ncbi:MAG TPA: hypothetical protein EYQ54_14880 [Myxococcales bacterium]|nr:hypothetical protein [Myxococcales bacterium]